MGGCGYGRLGEGYREDTVVWGWVYGRLCERDREDRHCMRQGLGIWKTGRGKSK